MINPGLNILLIEDNPDDQDLIQEYLCSAEYNSITIIIEESLKNGIKILDEKKVDLILLDLSLPDSFGLDGFKNISKFIQKFQ